MKRLLALAILFGATPAVADTNVTTLRNAAATIQFELRDAEGATPGLNLEASAVCAAGDAVVIIDGAAAANATNCFVDETGGIYSIALTAAQLAGKVTTLKLVDQTATKVWVDKVINVYTYGDSSAFHGMAGVNVTQIEGADATDTIDARVNAQVLDVLNVDTFTELTACPTSTASMRTMIQFVYSWFLQKKDKDSATSLEQLFRANGTTVLCERPYGVTGTVTDLGAYVTP